MYSLGQLCEWESERKPQLDLCVALSPAFSPGSAEGPRGWEQGLCWSQRHSQSCPCLLGTRLGLMKIESVDHLREGTELITQLETSGPTVPRQTLGSSNGSTVSMLVSTITWEESSTRNYLDHIHV